MVQKMLDYLEQISKKSYDLLSQKFLFVFSTLKISKNEHLMKSFESYLRELPVVGFNSGKYDINLVKKPFFKLLHSSIEFVVKRNNNFVCIKTCNLKFLDIINYIAPGFSYQNFIKAYGVKDNKFFFPFEWLDTLDKLDYSELPSYESFYSSLKKSSITKEEYAFVAKTWKEKNWKSVKDMLVFYNNGNVGPFLRRSD